MRLCTVAFLLGATHLAMQSSPQAGNHRGGNPHNRAAKVEGKTVDSISSVPIGTVTLTLRTGDAGQASKYSATSDTEGRFHFDYVEPGRYILYAEKRGFLRCYYGGQRTTGSGTPLTLSEGQIVNDLVFKMTPQGVILGKITDEAGEPMDMVSVSVMQWGYLEGKRFLRPAGGALSNDLGEYRIANVSPGRYYLVAQEAI